MPVVDPLWVFLGLSLVFGVLAIREYRKNDGELTIAGRNWRRIGLIFGVITFVLLALRY